jgi:aldose 1-epimerase
MPAISFAGMAAPTPVPAPFGTLPDGRSVDAFVLANARGTRVRVLALGGILQAVHVAGRDGTVADVALGYDTLDGYLADPRYLGALVGRYANRIAAGRFTLDGTAYALATNNGANHLHGGPRGFHTALWAVEPFVGAGATGLVLRHVSPDGDEGYPGTLAVQVTYTLGDDDVLAVDYHATTDRATPVNLTQHAYWNLAGHAAGSVRDHELTIAAARYTPVDAGLIPTGEQRPVAGTPFDFTAPQPIGARIDADDEQLARGLGYDHNFVLDGAAGGAAAGPAFAARLRDPASGRVLALHTTEPGLQFYSGNVLPGGPPGKGGVDYAHRGGLALETQHFPDSPNQPAFPSTILRPGAALRSRTEFRFSVE